MKPVHSLSNLPLSRREAMQRLTLLVGTTLSLPVQAALQGQRGIGAPVRFCVQQQTLIADLAETILPTTDTPGARVANVSGFIEHIIEYCTESVQQEAFQRGLQQTDGVSRENFSKRFSELDHSQRTLVMEQLARREKSFFLTLRELTIVGYFTSETGATQALDYVAVPGQFNGDIPLKPGQRAWAT